MTTWLRRRVRQSRRFVGLTPTRSLVQSFNYAFDGVIHTLATQRNMRIHFLAATVALLACVVYGVGRVEFAIVVLAAGFVIAAEMLNTAVEAAIDVSTTSFNPLAKVAKDVAAGAVLIATFVALSVGFLVFGSRLGDTSRALVLAVKNAPINLTIIALTLTLFAVIALKAVGARGTPLRGGFPSGHAALAFSIWMAVTLTSAGFSQGHFISAFTFLLALLVAHTRVESGVHTWYEVLAGAIVGALITLLVFNLIHLVA